MFDSIHTGQRCGQVKCLGQGLRDYRLGDRVSLVHRVPPASGGVPFWMQDYDEVPVSDAAVLPSGGGVVIVRDSVIVEWVDQLADGMTLPILDHAGISTNRSRITAANAAIEDAQTCHVCWEIRGGVPLDLAEELWLTDLLEGVDHAPGRPDDPPPWNSFGTSFN